MHRQLRAVSGVVHLAFSEPIQQVLLRRVVCKPLVLGLDHSALAVEPADAIEYLIPLGGAAIGFPGGLVLLDLPVLFVVTQRQILEPIFAAATLRNDVLDVELGMRAEEGTPADGLACVWANAAALFEQNRLADVPIRRGLNACFVQQLPLGFLPLLFNLAVSVRECLPLLAAGLEVACEFNANEARLAVLTHNGIGEASHLGQRPFDRGISYPGECDVDRRDERLRLGAHHGLRICLLPRLHVTPSRLEHRHHGQHGLTGVVGVTGLQPEPREFFRFRLAQPGPSANPFCRRRISLKGLQGLNKVCLSIGVHFGPGFAEHPEHERVCAAARNAFLPSPLNRELH